MKNFLLLLVYAFLLLACSSSDNEFSVEQNNEGDGLFTSARTDESEGFSVELVSVDSCIGHFSSPVERGVDSLLLKRDSEDLFFVSVLGNTQCPPAESPDYIEYSLKGDTLFVDIDKKNRSFDVLCTCDFWSVLQIKGEIKFNKIWNQGTVYRVYSE